MADDAKRCTAKTEVYSRVCGFYRPVQEWNRGKRSEFADRKTFDVGRALQVAKEGKEAKPDEEQPCSSNG